MRALQTKVPVPVQAHPRKSAVGNCSTCQRLRPYCSHVVDNCSTCQRHCVNGCDWRAGLCERLRTTSCIHELAVQDAMHSAPIAKRVLSAIAWITHARTWLRSIPRWTPSSSLSDIMEELQSYRHQASLTNMQQRAQCTMISQRSRRDPPALEVIEVGTPTTLDLLSLATMRAASS